MFPFFMAIDRIKRFAFFHNETFLTVCRADILIDLTNVIS